MPKAPAHATGNIPVRSPASCAHGERVVAQRQRRFCRLPRTLKVAVPGGSGASPRQSSPSDHASATPPAGSQSPSAGPAPTTRRCSPNGTAQLRTRNRAVDSPVACVACGGTYAVIYRNPGSSLRIALSLRRVANDLRGAQMGRGRGAQAGADCHVAPAQPSPGRSAWSIVSGIAGSIVSSGAGAGVGWAPDVRARMTLC